MIKNNYFIFIICFASMLVFLHINQYTYISDDVWFSKVSIDEQDHWGWVIKRYYHWSSRTPIEYALISLINHYNIWSILNSIMFATLLTSICKLGISTLKNNTNLISLIVVVICIYCIPKNIFFDGVIWVTGSFNYLWPLAFSVLSYALAIKIISSGRSSAMEFAIAIISIAISSFNEQLAVVNTLVLFSMIAFCIINKNSAKMPFAMLACTALVLVYIATCPGNKVRFDREVVRWFTDYNELGFFKKILLGLNLYTDSLFAHKSLVPAIMAFSVSLVCKGKIKYLPMISGVTLTIFNLLYSPPQLLSKIQFNANDIISYLSFGRIILAFIISMLIFIPLVISSDKSIFSFMLPALLVGAVASASMLGFSPTVYASSDRVLFVTFLLFIIATSLCISKFVIEFNKEYT
ncbi:TPA: hypothetical protein U2L98_000590 [Enterobacter hormaechei]|uniref:DUF6056 family protein n=1 Tax=Enterobacter hormaechei TaxID=158836 RepID=UPI000F892EC4|nr:DUF6056 family protein [Enterobacter hormaechei]MCE1444205.1 DUF6056 family protein [Enterobacter hormaechei]MCE1452575.1 DUF6056 family protein [Enterobacter hormaechei]RTO92160.1 hypothetical protein EKN54_02250 [Enterobacter hormaechei]HEM8101590.1 hypothetical protein [Enterobacter hormaechei]HEM8123686.1 hypothetical protein [Enterobacter hormaechei]